MEIVKKCLVVYNFSQKQVYNNAAIKILAC